jgi:hypothetical protein
MSLDKSMLAEFFHLSEQFQGSLFGRRVECCSSIFRRTMEASATLHEFDEVLERSECKLQTLHKKFPQLEECFKTTI